MNHTEDPPSLTGARRLLSWRRLRVVLIGSLIFSLPLLPNWGGPIAFLLFRMVFVGMSQSLVFGLFERWPSRLPNWLARWALQIIAVAVVVPFAVAVAYTLTSFGDPIPWHENPLKVSGFGTLTGLGVLFAPWIAMTALYRQISGQAQRQTLAFDLERSEFARNALDSRLRLLQAQIEPHFLFNTLANIRELVDSGSPQASPVLNSLIAYLRASVPRLNDAATTLGQELDLVRAYLELMHMRMPDRLQFTIEVEDSALPVICPPMTLLTLVENAVVHGIDPSEEGGQIEVRARVSHGRLRAEVIDTGIGLGLELGSGLKPEHQSKGLGTGLASLRERLHLVFAGDALVNLTEIKPHGVMIELNFPAQTSNSATPVMQHTITQEKPSH